MTDLPLPAKVCLIPGTIGGGGIGMVMLALAQGFRDQGIAVDLVLTGTLLPELSAGRMLPEGVRLVMLSPRARGALPPLVRYLRKERPDLMISARDYINLLALAAHRLARLGPTCHLIWSFHTHPASQRTEMRLLERGLYEILRRFLRAPDARVCVSDGIADNLARVSGLPRAAFQVIDNPAWSPARAQAAAEPCPHQWLAARAPGDSDPAAPVILGIGRLVAQKDFYTLIAAFAQLRQRLSGAQLILLGEGQERPALQAQIARLGLQQAIDLPGHVANPLSYLSRADLFVLSSRWEGQPVALIEALGCGCPVVSTDCPTGPADILGDTLGLLVPPGDAPAMAAAMEQALQHPRPAPDRVQATLARFTPARAAAAYLGLAR
ncbi:glycosyltransferase [Cereibacter azotoformans]|uniref:glycosyltransferase n=1 Tax=Cereibacter azotoformans TaxID=43057 RepID=UPI000C6D20E2|nr:glycosyltransferase [Cereibacter azotoformans]